METAVEHMIGFSVALTGIIVLLAMMGLEVRKIDRQLAEIERLLSVDDERPTAERDDALRRNWLPQNNRFSECRLRFFCFRSSTSDFSGSGGGVSADSVRIRREGVARPGWEVDVGSTVTDA